ncbi:fibronectin type III domain-containing protein [Kiritimatiellota bacterium B12222]|nr:fibronectin type III domain-containing protein [Kiritimatiellota bacterium B12222]
MIFPMCRSLSILLLIFLSGLLRGLTIEGYSATSNDRFANDPSFIANSFDLSGVAISSDGKWATMISPNVFLTANHYTPGTGQTLTFYQTNDPSGPSVTRTVNSTQLRIGSSDLRLVTLDIPLPEGYTFYTVETRPINNYWGQYGNEEHFHLGRSPGNYATSRDIGVGKNVVDIRYSNRVISSPQASGPAIECKKDSGNDAIPYETYAVGGDSGAPLMIDNNGTLKLIGISWYQTTTTEDEVTSPYSTGFSPVGDYHDDIDDFLDDYSLPFQPLAPENFAAIRISDTQINLSWTDASEVETDYNLTRAESADGPWTEIASISADSESYQDLSASDTDLYYRLVARNLKDITSYSDSDGVEISVLTPYSIWAAQYDWQGADQSPTGDANNDGIQNLLAYSMNLSPLDTLPTDALPTLEVSTTYIDYSYRINTEATELSYSLISCNDLLDPDWQPVQVNGTTITETIVADRIRIRMQADQLLFPLYFRLQVQ